MTSEIANALLDNTNEQIFTLNNARTEEVADIIEKMPKKFGWIVSLIVMFIVVSIFVFGWFIKYPDVLKGQITINSRQSPIKFTSNLAGNLILLHKDSTKKIAKGEYIAMIKNSASVDDVNKLNNLLSCLNIRQANYQQHRHFFPENLEIGELNNKYFSFLNALYQYLDYTND